MTPNEKIIKAKVGLLQDHPFFGSIVCRWKLEEVPGIGTGACNSKVLKYDPAWIDSLSLPKTKGFLAHEAMHIADAHHLRRKGRDLEQWNIAGDMSINKILLDNKIDLPDDRIFSDEDKSAEGHYSDLTKPDPDGEPEGDPGDEQGDDGDGSGPGEGDGDQDGDTAPDPGGCGGVLDLQGEDGEPLTEQEQQEAENDARVNLAQAAQTARNMGRLPNGIERLVENILYPKLDFYSLLMRFMQRSARDNYSWTPPNRRFLHQDVYLPSLRSDSIKLVIATDTSMSITEAELNLFAGTINAILATFGSVELTVLYCDAAIQGDPEEYTSADLPVKLEPKGGGGTAFEPVFNWIEENQADPDCLIYLTDLYGSFPKAAPEYPVLWASISSKVAPFGETVMLE
jgi:predicted metal-dependent peptidase